MLNLRRFTIFQRFALLVGIVVLGKFLWSSTTHFNSVNASKIKNKKPDEVIHRAF